MSVAEDVRLPKTRIAGDRKLGVFATRVAWDVPADTSPTGLADTLSPAECDVPAIVLVGTVDPERLCVAAFRRVVLAPDADVAGDQAADVLLRELAPFARSVERPGPPALDGATAAQVRELVAKGAAGGWIGVTTDDGRLPRDPRVAAGQGSRVHPGAHRALLRHRVCTPLPREDADH